jgi:single-strand DNA-binding protein
MAGVNKVILVGNVGRDAEVRYTQNGTAVAGFSLATSESFSDRDGQRQERTEWHNVVVWGRQAEIAGQYVKKGRQLFVEGRLQTRDWVDPQGVKHYRTEVVASRFQLLGRREDGGGEYAGGGDYAGSGSYGGGGGGGYQRSGGGGNYGGGRRDGAEVAPAYDDFDVGDLGPPLDMDDNPLSPGD